MQNILLNKWRNLAFHWRETDWGKIRKLSKSVGLDSIPYYSLIKAAWKHGASPLNYFELGFYGMHPNEQKKWITRSIRYDITRQLNDPEKALILNDKLLFARTFADEIGRKVWSWQDLIEYDKTVYLGHIVAKPRVGSGGGKGVRVLDVDHTVGSLTRWAIDNIANPSLYIYEEKLIQHHELQALSPRAVSTLRIVTMRNKDKIGILGYPVLRMAVDASTDNFSSAGIAVRVEGDGTIREAGVYAWPLHARVTKHPISALSIVGFCVPYFMEAKNLALGMAMKLDGVRSVGWDVAITNHGPMVIEGNPAWGERVIQRCGGGLREAAESWVSTTVTYQ